MGFYGIIPASKLAATYNVKSQTLTLYAEGEVKEFTYGFSFRRVPFFGGLKFVLGAWTGPIGPKSQPYKFNEAFKIHLPSPVFPSGNVTIVTANHPNGQVVPIHYLGLLQDTAGLTAATATDADGSSNGTAKLTPGSKQINVLFKEPFTITASARVPEFGSVDINFDTKMLTLVDASIENTNIVWTFNSLETGDTQIMVTTHGGIATFISVETYDVRIFVL